VAMDSVQRLRLRWFLARGALGFTSALLETSYRIYLNHTKVIHYRAGRPVYSLSTPALYSKPSANLLARSLYRTIQNKNLPNMMSLAVNDACNARCEHCSFFEGVEDPTRTVLTTEQVSEVIRQGQELGVSVLNFVGGEPLLRQDLPELVRAVDKDLTTTVLFTNGSMLSDRASSLRKAGLDSVYVSIDSADPIRHDHFRGTPGLFDRAVAEFGRVDGLVNNAATNVYFGPMLGIEDGAWDKIFEVNVKGYFHCIRSFAARVKGPGSVVNIASIVGMRAAPLQGVYGMTKAAVISMTKSLAMELGSGGIRVNAIAPGLVETRFAQVLVDDESTREHFVGRTFLGRHAQPDEIAGAAIYLLSDASSYTTGHTIVIDGGMTAT